MTHQNALSFSLAFLAALTALDVANAIPFGPAPAMAAIAIRTNERSKIRHNAKRRADLVFADFEAADYGSWKATGAAFGNGPAHGALQGQMNVSGFHGRGLVNSFVGGDGSTGTLTSPEFTVARKRINFLIGGGKHEGATCINLVVDGKVVRTATGPNGQPGGTERLDWKTWEVGEFEGKTAHVEIIDQETGGWGHINVDEITMSDEKAEIEIETSPMYEETYRPQFHFSPKQGWMNDPNGMVYYGGEYHLFFQAVDQSLSWRGDLSWGHAVSKDMVHWKQIGDAIAPDQFGGVYSGSAVIDKHNSLQVGQQGKEAMVAFYTAAGGSTAESKGQPFTQRMVYSTDKGRTWTKYSGNPVVKHIAGENRDPKVVWDPASKQWIMALYLDKEDFALLSSTNLTEWKQFQTLTMPGSSECPDFFEMPVENNKGERKWVLTAANGRYFVGAFDGHEFKPEEGPHMADYGANYYAVQTFSDIPEKDGRRIQIAWMNGGSYPGMPFNQQMSFPCTLTLHKTADGGGHRLYRYPVKEISALYSDLQQRHDVPLAETLHSPVDSRNALLDIDTEIDLGDAKSISIVLSGAKITYDVASQTLTALGRSAPLKAMNNRIKLRMLSDRASLEVFGNLGEASLTSCFLPTPHSGSYTITASGGNAKLIDEKVRSLRSAWK